MKRIALITFGLTLACIAGARIAAPLLPDLGQIAFSRTSDQPQDIYLFDLRTAMIHNLTRTPQTAEMMPVWSADGRRLAFTLSGDNTVRVVDFSRAGLPVTDLDEDALAEFYPRWIAGSALPGISVAYLPVQVFARERLELRAYGGDVSLQPAYAPDGRSIVYVGVDERFRPGVLRTADLVTDVITTLTPGGYVFQYPAWSPDGRWLTAQYDHDSTNDLIVLDVTCLPGCIDAMRVLARRVGEASSPDWSADGRRIVYSCQIARGTAAICVHDLLSGKTHSLTTPMTSGRDLEPAWRRGVAQP
ncbi:MAG: PD40 domain-containing protein [Anaerolineae bacterium]|nr:PD40 domain-containing protein [Anaerolineae bacterium]